MGGGDRGADIGGQIDPKSRGQQGRHHHHDEGAAFHFGGDQQVARDRVDHITAGQQGAGRLEHSGDDQGAHHGQCAGPNGRTHIVGHVIGADIESHIAGDQGGDDHDIGAWPVAHDKGGPDAHQQQEDQCNTGCGQRSAQMMGGVLEARKPLQILVERAFAHVTKLSYIVLAPP